jgi:hypothetical protein
MKQILDTHQIPTDLQRDYCYVLSFIAGLQRRRQVNGQGYVELSSKVLLDGIGSHYPILINSLRQWGLLDCDDSYFHLEDWFPQETKDRCQAKCLGYKTDISHLVRIDFQRKRSAKYKKQSPTPELDAVSQYALQNLQSVIVTDNIQLSEDDPEKYVRGQQYLQKIHNKAFGLHRTESGRCYHAIIQTTRESRTNLRYKDGQDLVDVDVKSCFPTLLATMFSDQIEAATYCHDLEGDIYTVINSNKPRDTVKSEFCKFISEPNRSRQWLTTTDAYQYFSQYPVFMAEVLSRSDLAMTLQKIESSICVDELGAWCLEKKIWWVPMHDGALTLKSTEVAVRGWIQSKINFLLNKQKPTSPSICLDVTFGGSESPTSILDFFHSLPSKTCVDPPKRVKCRKKVKKRLKSSPVVSVAQDECVPLSEKMARRTTGIDALRPNSTSAY